MPREATLFGHPLGMVVIFWAELWERFCFYGIRGLIVLYFVQYFATDDNTAFATYGAFIALIYVFPALGGLIADRYLGYTRAVVFGAVLMIFGSFGLALSATSVTGVMTSTGGAAAVLSPLQLTYLSFALVIVGVGFLKSNITVLLGRLYPEGSPLTDSGFTIFAMGINIGAASAAFAVGYAGQSYGWSYGFGLAGIGIIVGLVIFLAGQKFLLGKGQPPDPARLKRRSRLGIRHEHILYGGTILAVLAVWYLIQLGDLIGYLVAAEVVVVLAATIYYSGRKLDKTARDKTYAALFVIICTAAYAIYIEQMGSSLVLFVDRFVDRSFFSGELRSAQVVGFLNLFIILLAPVIAAFWQKLGEYNRNPSSPLKFSLAFLIIAGGYLMLAYIVDLYGGHGGVGVSWVVFFYFIVAVSDLLIIPISMSLVTKLAAKNMGGLMMGIYMLVLSLGYFLSSFVARFSSAAPISGMEASTEQAVDQFRVFFISLGGSAMAIGLLLMVFTPHIRKIMHDVR